MANSLLAEAASLTDQGQKFRARLISEGTGSSATYPGDVLQRDGATALPVGTQIFFDHLTETEKWDRDGNHSIRDLVGITLTEAQWVEEERALYADVRFFGDHANFIAEAMDYVGLSVEIRSFELNEQGAVEYLGYSPLNAVSVVPRAGRDGKVTALLESYRENRGKIGTDENDGKEGHMKPEEIQALAEALVEGLKPSFEGLREALVPVTPEVAPAEDAADEDVVDRAEIVEAAIDAGLSKSARERVLDAVAGGTTLEEAIKAEKALREEILKEAKVEVTPGTYKGASTATDGDYSVGAWK